MTLIRRLRYVFSFAGRRDLLSDPWGGGLETGLGIGNPDGAGPWGVTSFITCIFAMG